MTQPIESASRLAPGNAQPADAAQAGAAFPPPVPDDGVGLPAQPVGPYVRLSFWQKPWVQELLPFLTSLVIHASILIVGLLVYGLFKAATPPAHEEQVIIPESALAQEGPPGGVPNEGVGNSPLQQAMQDKDTDAGEKGWTDKKGPSVDVTALSGSASDSTDAVIGLGPGGGFNKGKGMLGDAGNSGDVSGATAVFGAPGGGAAGPKGPVFGNGGNARTIIFVCDASGSMLTKWSALGSQISMTVHNDLGVRQAFNVIFFAGEGKPVVVFNKDGMVPATADSKLKFDVFMKKPFAAGDTDPIPGIEMALRQRPQLMYLLTDGEFPDNKGILAKINLLNKEHYTKINTIAFTDQADAKSKADVGFKKFLKQIADENGGVFRDVNADDL